VDLGRQLVACALRDETLTPFIEAGLSADYLADENDHSKTLIFDDDALMAWHTIQDHWDHHGKVPSMGIFRKSWPEAAFELPAEVETTAELIELFQKERRKGLAEVAVSDLSELLLKGQTEQAIELMAHSLRVIQDTHTSTSIVVGWDSPDYDVEGRIGRKLTRGVMTGIEGFDTQKGFMGFQPGSLTCYLGRAKAGKTSFVLLSALEAWMAGKRVMFHSFEIAAGRSPEEPGVADRLDSIGAGIHMLNYMQGQLSPEDADRLREFRESCVDDVFKVIQPTGRFTIADLERDIERYRPDIAYVDGFYFMTDGRTGKPGSNWEGHDNLANDIKALAMKHMIPIVITHQVREKQLTGKKGAGIDDAAMMGGTAIIMFADLVIGVDTDPDTQVRTLSCTRSRLNYLDTVYGTWNWNDCTFSATENPFDMEVFGYNQPGGGND
jgi:hypothetical protein